MRQTARVVLENGKLMAEVMRPEACEACRACRYGQQERRLLPLPAGEYHEGQQVELELPDGRVGTASLLAYGIPLVMLLLGLWLGSLLGGELYQALGALVMLALGCLILWRLEPRIRKSGMLKIEATPCHLDMQNSKEREDKQYE